LRVALVSFPASDVNETSSPAGFAIRVGLVVALGVVVTAGLYSWPALPQDMHYHKFADQRTILGVPHCLNVLSNVPFLIVGLLGLGFLASARGRVAFVEPEERRPYFIFSLGIALTAFGSAYYHFDPTNDRLLWDRLPMSIAFMALFAGVIGERINARAGRVLLFPLVTLGLASVLYWHETEKNGAGDLRPYFLVQFFPMLALPLIMELFPPRYTRTGDLWVALGLYALAKVVELLDGQIFAVLRVMSGHTLKHLVAAAGAFAVVHMIMKREVIKRQTENVTHLQPGEPGA
jgi:hypothetical protein